MSSLYAAKPLIWLDGSTTSSSKIGKYNYLVEQFEDRFVCSEGGADFGIRPTKEEAKKACQEHYESELLQYMRPAIRMDKVANVSN
ncbi:MAG: hypothetical protein ACWA44_02385 [Thiotrichales bacterium]